MKLSDATQDIQLLSNIGDLAVAGTGAGGSAVTSAAVKVKVFSTLIFDETMYAEDGTVWLRDVRGLLLPYLAPGNTYTINVVVGTVTTSFSVLYCLAELQKNSTETNATVMENNFPVTVNRKVTCLDCEELLPVYHSVNANASVSLSVEALYSIGSGVPTTSSLTVSVAFTPSAAIQYADVSPASIRAEIAEDEDVDEQEVHLYGYRVSRTTDDYESEMIYSIDLRAQEKQLLQLRYRNHFGLWESILLRGSEEMGHSYDFTNAYIAGRLKRIDTTVQHIHSFTLPLASDTDSAVAEAIIASTEVQVREPIGQWRDITITEASHSMKSELHSENSIQFTYRLQTKDHRRIEMENGTWPLPANTLTDSEGYVLTDQEGNILTDNTSTNEN